MRNIKCTYEAASHALEAAGKALSGPQSDPIPLGVMAIDATLGGGLMRGGLHEVFAAKPQAGPPHTGAAMGFAVALAVRAVRPSEDRQREVERERGEYEGKPILWVRQECLDREVGALSALGLRELGLNPEHLILVRARNPEAALRAGEEGVRCRGLGAVLIELLGEPRILGLTATRRLSLAASGSGVPALLLRTGGSPGASAAATRWLVEALPSKALAANVPGFPASALSLLRQRGGRSGSTWFVEWDRDKGSLRDLRPTAASAGAQASAPAGTQASITAASGTLVPVSSSQPRAASAGEDGPREPGSRELGLRASG